MRKYYQQDYINALSTGDIWACQAWSGDIFQALESGAKDLVFAIPSEGGVLWTDNMVLLKEIENPVSAMMLIDWYYQPKIAAEVAEYVNYITPVPSAQGVVERTRRRRAAPTTRPCSRSPRARWCSRPPRTTASSTATAP